MLFKGGMGFFRTLLGSFSAVDELAVFRAVCIGGERGDGLSVNPCADRKSLGQAAPNLATVRQFGLSYC